MSWLSDIMGYQPDMVKGSVRPKAYNWNPTEFAQSIAQMSEIYSFRHPGTIGMGYPTLFAASRTSLIAAIIGTRIAQISEYAVPQKSRYKSGYRIVLRDRNGKKSATRNQKKMMTEITKMVESAGGKYGYGGFEPFVRAIMRDSLVYDQANFEIIRSRGAVHTVNGKARRKVLGFVPVDASTIRRAKPTHREQKTGQLGYDGGVKYVQIVDDQQVAKFTGEELAWCIRRPRTTLAFTGYGFPELEELTKTVSDLLNATTYNSVNFTNGIHASTILTVKSSMDEQIFEAFKRNVKAMMYGVHNARRAAIVQLDPSQNEDIGQINMTQSNKDMEFGDWINFLLKVVCAVYLMDPAEIGFVYGNENQSQAMNGAGPEQRIVHSKERGLRPTLRQLESWMNHNVIYQYDPDFEMEMVGIDSLSESEQIELDGKAVRTFKTVNEIRRDHDLPPLDSPLADMILDGSYVASSVQMLMMEKQEEQMAAQMPPEDQADPGIAEEELEGVDLNDIDAVTQALVSGTEKSLQDRRVVPVGFNPYGNSRRGKIAMAKSSGKRSYIVEVL